ncbi:hypothetical protein C8Q73DRAFT_45282 [Cubamyces lactineus]|nr:hypothetical protein C8Q73DRAFT_45282 [Cubamyces lactineus]
MRLLNTETGLFHEIAHPLDRVYTILSHTWDPRGEQSYQELRNIQVAYEVPSVLRTLLFCIGTLLLHLLPSSIQCGNETSSAPISTLRTRYLVVPLAWARSLLEIIGRSWSTSSVLTDPRLSEKIRGACACARANGHRYIWIDSCCIDKSSSAELSEAINAMYNWYQFAAVCYVFLSDVPGDVKVDEDEGDFYYSRWHTRGWTLQELLAPAVVVFLSKDWRYLGTKLTLARQLEYRLHIPYVVLTRQIAPEAYSVAQRFSWAAFRETTRVEDRAYCLLGLFGINMPLLYGEGDRAFHRLQQAIWAQTADHTIFAWGLGGRFREIACLQPPPRFWPTLWTNNSVPGRRGHHRLSYFSDVCSHLATQPAAFAFREGMVSIPSSEYKRRLGRLPLNQRVQPTPPSPGGPIHLPLIPFEACLPSSAKGRCFSGLYLVPLACEWMTDRPGDKGNLVAIVCSKEGVAQARDDIDSESESDYEPVAAALKGGYVITPLPNGSEVSYRTVILTRSDLDRCRESIQSLGVLPNNYMRTGTSQSPAITLVTQSGLEDTSAHTSPTVHLAQWCRSLLAARGYEAASLSPVDPTSYGDVPMQEPIYGFRFTRADASVDAVLQYFKLIVRHDSVHAWTYARFGLVRKGASHLDRPDVFLGVSAWVLMYEGHNNSSAIYSGPAHGLEYHFSGSLRRASGDTFELGLDVAEMQLDLNRTALVPATARRTASMAKMHEQLRL